MEKWLTRYSDPYVVSTETPELSTPVTVVCDVKYSVSPTSPAQLTLLGTPEPYLSAKIYSSGSGRMTVVLVSSLWRRSVVTDDCPDGVGPWYV